MCKGVRFGGLGLGFLGWTNKVMLVKWFWRFGRKSGALWRNVICSKYGLQMEFMMVNLDDVRLSNCSTFVADMCSLLH